MTLNFSEDYTIENERVILTPLKKEHITHLVQFSKDQSIWRYLLDRVDDRISLIKYLDLAIKNRAEKKEYPFVIFDKKESEFAGTTRFYDYSSDLKIIKLGHTWYGKKFRGTNLNKHCKYLLFRFAFEELKIERIGFGVHSENKISNAALKSIGCKEEGVLRKFLPSVDKKGRADIKLWGILKNEWQTGVKTKQKRKLNS